MSKVSDAIRGLRNAMDEEGVDARNGLPLDLFEFSTTERWMLRKREALL